MEDKEILFEQYKLAVEMADRISARREGANKIFLSANSIIFAFLATQKDFSAVHIFITIFGFLLCIVWASIIQNYKSLNSVKYHIIHEMEEKLPWKVYADEWKRLKEGKDKKTHSKFTSLEKKLPWLFLGFYAVLFLYVIFSMFCWGAIPAVL